MDKDEQDALIGISGLVVMGAFAIITLMCMIASM